MNGARIGSILLGLFAAVFLFFGVVFIIAAKDGTGRLVTGSVLTFLATASALGSFRLFQKGGELPPPQSIRLVQKFCQFCGNDYPVRSDVEACPSCGGDLKLLQKELPDSEDRFHMN